MSHGVTYPPFFGAHAGRGTASTARVIRRFEPRYWTVDHPLTASASVITLGDDALRLTATLRTRGDTVGLKWESEDHWNAKACRWLTSGNYLGTVLQLNYALTGLPRLDDADGLVLSVEDDAGAAYYVRLANYVIAGGGGTSGTIRLDFAGPVYGGYDITDGAQRQVIPWHRISSVFFGVSPADYEEGSSAPITPLDVTIELSEITVTGSFSTLKRTEIEVQPHRLRMTDGYDDAYLLTPQRIVEGIWQLGYRDWYVIYVGASHLHELVYDAGEGRLVVDPAQPVSAASRAWFEDLFARLTARGYRIVLSQSYEILASICPTAWQQADQAGAGARTGWSPPSTLISPCSTAALGYLRGIADWLLGAVSAAGGALYYQIGEPWWWDGSFGGGGPCIYDAATTALYTAETGLPVPTPRITSSTQAIGIHAAYLAWLGDKLGASTLWLRDEMRTAHPGVTVLLLVFTPQVLMPGAPILTAINLPVERWSHPAFDLLQLEDYDWVTAEEWALHETTLDAGTVALGYPLDHLHYFAGFNLLPEDAAAVWPRILRAVGDGLTWDVAETFVWARPQIWRDGWMYPTGVLA
ncbi:hypothetical protein V5F77_28160, partial [Xanthobacter sp. DSM 24535]|uniref:non-contractile tail sheath protein n=1 Tax=Roseixanthobacter psychrophilus TaxID=3119917 RepID=UPI003729E032